MLRAESAKADSAKSVKALVLLPTRELAQQVHEQYEQLRGKNMPKAALVIGGVAEKRKLTASARAANSSSLLPDACRIHYAQVCRPATREDTCP